MKKTRAGKTVPTQVADVFRVNIVNLTNQLNMKSRPGSQLDTRSLADSIRYALNESEIKSDKKSARLKDSF